MQQQQPNLVFLSCTAVLLALLLPTNAQVIAPLNMSEIRVGNVLDDFTGEPLILSLDGKLSYSQRTCASPHWYEELSHQRIVLL
eukprot:m.168634 g.168634  ORF g.168634 m.168634 type:complete len:84 (-) comp14480_c2_seq2:783-1034(-)